MIYGSIKYMVEFILFIYFCFNKYKYFINLLFQFSSFLLFKFINLYFLSLRMELTCLV